MIALSCSTSWAFDFVPASASSRCSVETNSSFMPSASAWAASSTFDSCWPTPGGEPPLDFGRCFSSASTIFSSCADVRADLLEHRPHDAAVLGQQRGQQMHRLDLRIPSLGRQLLRAGHRFLGLDRQFVETEWHG